LLLFLLLSVVFVMSANYYEAQLKFDSFVETYKKEYATEVEMLYRFQIFTQSLDLVDMLNKYSKGEGAVFGITKFSDLTREEFKRDILMQERTPVVVDPARVLRPKIVDIPASFDWRKSGGVTPVKDQGQCGSCWAFSVVENVESMWIISGKANASDLRLSEQQVVDCDSVDAGCNGGDPPTAFQYIMQAGGLESEDSYPYTAEDGSCQFSQKDVVAQVKDWRYATSQGDEKTMQQNLVSWGPLSICVDAEYWQYYTSGVLTAWQCAWFNSLDHCVQLVGYSQESSQSYWIVRNSWGTDWGLNGYIQLEMFTNACGLSNEATTALV